MKKFSKESMQQFMLMHAEKLILGACLAATGVFVWMSMGGEKQSVKTPSELLTQADTAERYVNREAWSGEKDSLQNFRQGKVNAKEQIVSTQPVDGSKFKLAFGGSPAEALAPRKDPAIFAPEQLVAHRVTAGIMMDLLNYKSPLSEFNAAPENAEDQGRGFGGFQGGDDDYGDDLGGYGAGGTSKNELPEEFLPLDRGSVFNDVNATTFRGIRPAGLGISEKSVTNILDVVCVTAVVDFSKQSAAFENAFAESIAYNAKRDRPVYQCVQVQRREVSDKGEKAEWQDITENVTYKYSRSNPLKPMPFQVSGSAPEVISPDNFDPILTQPIPAFAQLDYQKLASHPALKKLREFPAWQPPKKLEKLGGGEVVPDIFDQVDPDDEMDGRGGGGPGDEDGINGLRNGTETESYKEAIVMRKPGGQYRLVRFFDLLAPKKKSFEYRVRVWVGDPNQIDPTDGFKKNRGMQLEPTEDNDRLGNDDDAVRFAAVGDGMSGGGMDDMDDFGDEDTMDGGRPEVVVPVKPTMLIPAARKRVSAGTDIETMQDRLVAEARNLAKVERTGKKVENNLQPFHVAEYSDDGQLVQVELPPSPGRYAYIQYLRYARPSAWSESVRVEKELPSGDVLAGATVRKRSASVELSGRLVEFDQIEPSIKVVVSSWVRFLGARLPAEREAYIGETMNFNDQAYVTHPISWSILVPEYPKAEGMKKYTLPFRSNETIVDAFFGSTQQMPNDKRQSIEVATEILTMDANGNLSVSNQFESATDYRNELAMPDDSRFFGRLRRPKKAKEEQDEYGDDYSDDY